MKVRALKKRKQIDWSCNQRVRLYIDRKDGKGLVLRPRPLYHVPHPSSEARRTKFWAWSRRDQNYRAGKKEV